MIITREGIVEHWRREPQARIVPDGYICLNWHVHFPDVETLSPDEKKILKPVLERHPEYLRHEIVVRGEGVGKAIIQ